MELTELTAYCLDKPGAEETYPFGEDNMVVKVGGRGFAFVGLGGPASVTLKAGDEAAEWRDRYPESIRMASYLGRFGWNSVRVDGDVPDDELCELVDDSYHAVVSRLPRIRRPPGWDDGRAG